MRENIRILHHLYLINKRLLEMYFYYETSILVKVQFFDKIQAQMGPHTDGTKNLTTKISN